MGVDKAQPVHAWLYGQDGHLVLHTPWVRFPDTVVRIVTELPVPDTVPALIAPEVLAELVQHLESARITLTLPPTALQPIGVRAVDFQAVLVPIDRWSAERSGLEKLLREFRKVETVFADDDGDYPILTAEGNHLWVRLRTDRDPVSVEVFSVLATDVEGTEDLLRELNAMNADGAYVRVVWSNGAVLAEHDLVAATLDLTELANAVEVVSSTADRYRGVLSAFFGPGGTVTDDVGIQDL